MLKHKQRRLRIAGPAGDAIEVSGFITEGQFLRLRAPIRVRVYRDGTYWIHEYQPLSIDGIGRTREESKLEFLNHFLVCWREYALERDAKLDTEARKLKRGLLGLVDKIEAIG